MMRIFLLTVLGIFAAGMVHAQGEASDANKPAFKFDNDVYNFGTIKQGEKVEHEFVFTNTGNEPLVITRATGSCGCTVPVWPKEPIRKGESAKIKVTFNSAGKQGMQDKTITINSNAADNPKVLHIKGNIEVPSPTQQADSDK